ncbi:AMED_5909 family protein [Lentzea alba]|nr:AMED_5909 family protein [Lentzea alba]
MSAVEVMTWSRAEQVKTLSEAHDVLSKLLPNPKSKPEVLKDYYLRSAAIYARVAETDRSHHHEAIYWANREREKGEAIKLRKS